MIVWKIKCNGSSCVVETFWEAFDALKNNREGYFYPVLMSRVRFDSLKEFTGW